MPGYDGTGPQGRGPMTGRRMGPCASGYGRESNYGRGQGYGRGYGRNWPCFYQEPVTFTKEEQKKMLEAELKAIEEEKKAIEKTLKELKE